MADDRIVTPKRKRTHQHDESRSLDTHTAQFVSLDDPSASPRSRVVHRFEGLALEYGSGVGLGGGGSRRLPSPSSAPSPSQRSIDKTLCDDDVGEEGMRKRQKVPEFETNDARSKSVPHVAPIRYPWPVGMKNIKDEIPETPQQNRTGSTAAQSFGAVQVYTKATLATDAALLPGTESADAPIQSDITFVEHPPSRTATVRTSCIGRRKRAGTPPLTVKMNPTAVEESADQSAATHVVDPVRASLTWHEDEITVYDPDDSDDDGIGINGIGFKPTPALAYARTVKRRQQLAEYRKREEREARSQRSQRRRGTPVSGTSVTKTESRVSAGPSFSSSASAGRESGLHKDTISRRKSVRFMDGATQAGKAE